MQKVRVRVGNGASGSDIAALAVASASNTSDSLARFRLGGATSHSNLRRAVRVSWQNWVMYRRHGIAVKTALRRVGYKFLRRLAKSVLSLEHLRRIKEIVRPIPFLGAVWKTNGKNITQKV